MLKSIYHVKKQYEKEWDCKKEKENGQIFVHNHLECMVILSRLYSVTKYNRVDTFLIIYSLSIRITKSYCFAKLPSVS